MAKKTPKKKAALRKPSEASQVKTWLLWADRFQRWADWCKEQADTLQNGGDVSTFDDDDGSLPGGPPPPPPGSKP